MRTLLTILLAALLLPAAGSAKLRVVASTADLAYFANVIGGKHLEVESIASPRADIHFVEVRPSYMIKVSNAEVVLKVGLELDSWMDQIIDGSRNSNLRIIDCSKYIEPMEVPSFRADARYGDLHRFGNPHYWLGPQNVPAITRAIVEGLTAADPAHTADFTANEQLFLNELTIGLNTLSPQVDSLRGLNVIFYHNSWPYFNAYVGLNAAGFVEPFPGVPPSPSHMKELGDLIRERQIRIIAIEPYFDPRVPKKIAEESKARVVTLYPSVGGRQSDESYLEWFAGNVHALLEAIR